jgi:hypothetical protein
MIEFIIIGIVLIAGIVAIIFMLNSDQEDNSGMGLCSKGGGMSREQMRVRMRPFYPKVPDEMANILLNALDTDGDGCFDEIDVANFNPNSPAYQAAIAEYIQIYGLPK